jgi:nickel-type superoxide dismutase maturation protease
MVMERHSLVVGDGHLKPTQLRRFISAAGRPGYRAERGRAERGRAARGRTAGIGMVAGIGPAAVAAAVAWAAPRRLVIQGASMRPTLEPGDRVITTRAVRIRPGDIVAVPDPRRPDRLLVKRVATVEGAQVTVVGDNRDASTDSRTFGPVRRIAILGKVRYRYAPRDRAGRPAR